MSSGMVSEHAYRHPDSCRIILGHWARDMVEIKPQRVLTRKQKSSAYLVGSRKLLRENNTMQAFVRLLRVLDCSGPVFSSFLITVLRHLD